MLATCARVAFNSMNFIYCNKSTGLRRDISMIFFATIAVILRIVITCLFYQLFKRLLNVSILLPVVVLAYQIDGAVGIPPTFRTFSSQR